MNVLAWIAPGTWPAVIEALRRRPDSDSLTLVAAADPGEALPPGAFAGLLGRGRREPRDGAQALSTEQATALLAQAQEALGRPCRTTSLSGPTERVITAAAADADWLIIARDGDRSRLGPHSLGRHARFVIDHAPCTVELIWPEKIPDLATIPAPPTGLSPLSERSQACGSGLSWEWCRRSIPGARGGTTGTSPAPPSGRSGDPG